MSEMSAFSLVLDRLDIMVKPSFSKYQNHYENYYTCAIAFSLAHQLGRSALAIAQMLAESVSELVSDRVRVEVVGDGWLNFALRDWYMAESLCTLSHAFETRSDAVSTSGSTISTIDFPGYTNVQYAYARCCALLRLAQQQELVRDLHTFSWQLLDPEGDLYLRAATEQRLAFYLLTIADEIVRNSTSPRQLEQQVATKLSKKLSRNLAANFLDFYDSCRIVGAECELAMARIGLIAITKKAIAHLVADQIFLPESL